jgi:hypothetical protein
MRRVINMVIWIETVSHTRRITAEGAVLVRCVSCWVFGTRGVFLDYSVEVMLILLLRVGRVHTGADESM